LYARFSGRLLSVGLDRDVNEMTPVQDEILGTAITGTGHTQAHVHFGLVPNAHRAQLETVFTGSTAATTVGINGPAIIHSTSTTSLEGHKNLLVGFGGIVSGSCATACACTHSCINCIDTCECGMKGNIVVKVATRRSARKKPEAEAIASDHAAARLRGRMDTNIGGELTATNQRYHDKFLDPIWKRGVLPHDVHLATTTDFLYLVGTESSANQTAASGGPTAFTGPHDLGLQLHESFVNNAASTLLAGKTLTDEDFKKTLVDVLGRVPADFDEKSAFIVVFPEQEPVVAKFDNDMVTISVHGMQFKADEDRQIPEATITAEYKIDRSASGTRLLLQEDPSKPAKDAEKKNYLTIKFKTQRLGTAANEPILRKKFGKIFRPEIVLNTVLPGNWQKAGQLPIAQVNSQWGWLTLGWAMQNGTATPTNIVESDQPAVETVAEAK
jgi:hypothetical protein